MTNRRVFSVKIALLAIFEWRSNRSMTS